jgi:hypothetical protein
MINPSLECAYEELERLHLAAKEAAARYYQLKYAERVSIKNIKFQFRPGECYKKWASKARAISKKNWGVKGKRMQIDHRTPLLYCFLAGMTPEEASRKENLQLLTKDANRKKSFIRE